MFKPLEKTVKLQVLEEGEKMKVLGDRSLEKEVNALRSKGLDVQTLVKDAKTSRSGRGRENEGSGGFGEYGLGLGDEYETGRLHDESPLLTGFGDHGIGRKLLLCLVNLQRVFRMMCSCSFMDFVSSVRRGYVPFSQTPPLKITASVKWDLLSTISLEDLYGRNVGTYPSLNQNGTHPPELVDLSDLAGLSMSGSLLSGPNPKELGNLARLVELRPLFEQF
ncbi:hypothetical protein SUGI_0698650 [Cryptomeria japonica]|nr:hypothetical protein SUGI_0698650 [Cryptomeria japonica]